MGNIGKLTDHAYKLYNRICYLVLHRDCRDKENATETFSNQHSKHKLTLDIVKTIADIFSFENNIIFF